MYFRVKRTGSYAYLQIVESFREQGRVHQRVLSTVGRLDVLQSSGQLETLMRSGLRFCEKLAVIDAHAAGQTEPVRVERVGPELVFGRLWEVLQSGDDYPAGPAVSPLRVRRRAGRVSDRAASLVCLGQ